MQNLDELTENRKSLSTVGRGELLGLINMLLDERKDLLGALKPKLIKYVRSTDPY